MKRRTAHHGSTNKIAHSRHSFPETIIIVLSRDDWLARTAYYMHCIL